jgi:hypothetical protein
VKIARAWRTVRDLIPLARAWRSYATPKRLLVPFDAEAGVPTVDALEDLPAFGDPRVDAVAACSTGDEVRALWVADYEAGRPWPGWLNEIASIRVGELAQAALADAGLVSEMRRGVNANHYDWCVDGEHDPDETSCFPDPDQLCTCGQMPSEHTDDCGWS